MRGSSSSWVEAYAGDDGAFREGCSLVRLNKINLSLRIAGVSMRRVHSRFVSSRANIRDKDQIKNKSVCFTNKAAST